MKPGAAGGGGKAGSVGGAGHRGGDEENGDTDKQAPHMQVSPPLSPPRLEEGQYFYYIFEYSQLKIS